MLNPANTPMSILQSIAAGWVGGEAARAGGMATAALGLFSEFLLTGIMAAVYIIASQWITGLRKFWWVFGPCSSAIVIVAMYAIVLPLAGNHGGPNLRDGGLILANCKPKKSGKVSAAVCSGRDHQLLYANILVHVFAIGLVISASARFLWPARQVEPLAA